MKPALFQYECPTQEEHLVQILSSEKEGTKILAGGQSLLQLMNQRLLQPEMLVDINQIEEFHFIRDQGTSFAVGPLIRHQELVDSAMVREWCPMLSKAARFIGHRAVRNRGTAVGSLAHADPNAELPTVIVALGGELVVADQWGRRTIQSRQFFLGINETVLSPGQYLRAAVFPKLGPREGHAFVEFSIRKNDPAIVAVAVSIFTDEFGVVTRVRGALSGVANVPLYFEDEAHPLLGTKGEKGVVQDVATRLASGLRPPDSLFALAEYRRELAAYLLRQAFKEAYAESVWRGSTR